MPATWSARSDLFAAREVIYPQFATHNAYTVAAVLELAPAARRVRVPAPARHGRGAVRGCARRCAAAAAGARLCPGRHARGAAAVPGAAAARERRQQLLRPSVPEPRHPRGAGRARSHHLPDLRRRAGPPGTRAAGPVRRRAHQLGRRGLRRSGSSRRARGRGAHARRRAPRRRPDPERPPARATSTSRSPRRPIPARSWA